ncbi:MAG: protein-methionine-sulfoxide reductase heme-binding subunit MsrQ [Betaproteobacteria bacterium]
MPSFNFIRLSVFVASLLPLGRLAWLGVHDDLSANPLEFVTRSTGTWALVFLCLSLSITPLKRLTGQPQWMKLRRMLGLYCFFYALLHFTLWLWLDHDFDLLAMGRDVLKRPFITAGFTAFILLLPLAVTSTKGMMRRLGARWVKLHRLVYLIALSAILHYWWHKAGKNDFATVSLYALAVAGLLGIRVYWAAKGWSKTLFRDRSL